MASIPDKNRGVLKEAAFTVLDFTESELQDIDALAAKLRAITETAKEREQENFRKVR